MNRSAVLYALVSAALFGVSTPAAKVLVGSVHPAVLAGLLCCGAGIGVAVLRRALPSLVSRVPEVAISAADRPWLAAAICAGGILGPLLLMAGLARTERRHVDARRLGGLRLIASAFIVGVCAGRLAFSPSSIRSKYFAARRKGLIGSGP